MIALADNIALCTEHCEYVLILDFKNPTWHQHSSLKMCGQGGNAHLLYRDFALSSIYVKMLYLIIPYILEVFSIHIVTHVWSTYKTEWIFIMIT